MGDPQALSVFHYRENMNMAWTHQMVGFVLFKFLSCRAAFLLFLFLSVDDALQINPIIFSVFSSSEARISGLQVQSMVFPLCDARESKKEFSLQTIDKSNYKFIQMHFLYYQMCHSKVTEDRGQRQSLNLSTFGVFCLFKIEVMTMSNG